jgi:hypothetical protein
VSDTDHQRRVQAANALSEYQGSPKASIVERQVTKYPIHRQYPPTNPDHWQTWRGRRILLLLGLTILSESDAEKPGKVRKGAEPETGLHDDRGDRGEQDLRVKQPEDPTKGHPAIRGKCRCKPSTQHS